MTAIRLLGVLAVVAAAILWGTTGTVQALLPETRNPLAVGALRLAIGAASLVMLALLHQDSRAALPRLPWGGIVAAGIAIAGYNLLFFRAVSEAGVGIGTAITIGSAPVWATLWESAVTRGLPAPLRLGGQALSILGVGLLGFTAGGSAGATFGVLLAMGAGGCYAAYSLFTSAVGHKAPSTAIAAATFTVAALVAAPALFFVPLDWLTEPGAIWGLLFLGVGATGLSYALYTWGLTRVAASTAVTLALTEPVTAWILATVIVGEPATAQSVAGALLIFAGLVIVTIIPAKRA